jgi:hypothetical protein
VPEFKAFFDQLATFCRIVVFDKAGVGHGISVLLSSSYDPRPVSVVSVVEH